MRNERFKAAHRGGPLDLPRQRLLARWAADCAERALPFFRERRPQDDRPRRALETARAWARGEVSAGAARAAALEAHAAARAAAGDDAAEAAARAAGHAVATAHMADHARVAAAYALRAVQAADGADRLARADRERLWQQEHLPDDVRELMSPP